MESYGSFDILTNIRSEFYKLSKIKIPYLSIKAEKRIFI